MGKGEQRLCFSLSEKYDSPTCSMRKFSVLASLCCRAGWVGPNLVKRPNDKLLSFLSSSAIILIGKRELAALL